MSPRDLCFMQNNEVKDTKLEIPLQNMTCIGSSTFLILYQVILNINLFFSA